MAATSGRADGDRNRLKRRLCVAAASEGTVRAFLAPHLRAMQRRYDVTLVVNTVDPGLLNELGVDGLLLPVSIERRISPWRDVTALLSLYRLFRHGRFDLVHSITPKAGLLAMTAAWLARVPVRAHTFTGQVWATRRGAARLLLRAADTLVARLATAVLADSASQRDFLAREGVVSRSAMRVLANGSVSGVDANRFRPDPLVREAVRTRLAIPSDGVVISFVGRLNADKGVLDLAAAFHAIADERSDAHLLIVGPDESALRPRIAAVCGPHVDRVRFLEFTRRPEDAMAAADVLCLPSYREGFGSVVIEAAACGLPAVASRIYGIVDAVEEEQTGLLHAPGDVGDLARQLRRLVADADLRRALGAAARERALAEFPVERLTSAQLSLYAELLDGIPAAGWYRRFGKRALDVSVSACALLLLSPVLVILGIVVRAWLGAPVLFRQRRPGLRGVPFTLVKFRSMADRYDRHGQLLPDGDRLNGLGRFLRSTSLDELPELWNVLTGEMSLVGPRPLLMQYLDRYAPEQARRHELRPGITGWAQVNGRNTLTWADKFRLDVWYVDHVSFWLDCRIVLRTAAALLTRRGISQPGHPTAEEFTGARLAER
jgi:lipopolysaccharide/colanic/teichoic acid biosynthesis glycosyltransferase/glycosyltransferase involved in cell wall biosynthesis